MSRSGGVISGGFQPLKAPNAPTIDSVSAGVLSAQVSFTAPANQGEGTISSYVVTAKQSDGTSVSNTGASSPITLTLTAGGTTEFAAQAFSEYGPGQFSGFGNSTPVFSGLAIYTWGLNAGGQLGLDNTISRSSPTQVGSDTTWASISAADHNLAVKTDGTLWAWGYGANGRLGDNSVLRRSSPIQIGALTNWAQVSASDNFSGAIKTDGTLWMWGEGGKGQTAQGNTIDRSSPVQVGALTDWAFVSTGQDHSLAVKTDGTLWAWGDGPNGKLGTGNEISRSSPVQVGALTNWAKVSAGNSRSGAIKTDGTLWTWGFNQQGNLGDGTVITASSPVQVGALTNWSVISMGTTQSGSAGAINSLGELYTWGQDNNGSLGINIFGAARSSPTQVGALTDWKTLSVGNNFCMATKTNNSLFAWGYGGSGKTGFGDTIDKSSPVQVGALTNWSQVDTGYNHTAAVIGVTS